MIIQINTDKTISGNQRHQDYFTTLITEGLKKYSDHIARIEVHLSDENGNKEGFNDIRCFMEARLEKSQPIIAITNQADTVELAVSGAINKLKGSLEKMHERSTTH